MSTNQSKIRNLTIAALLLALALVLPFLTGQIPTIGSMLSPMHLPVLLAGFICGPVYGAIAGFIAPLLRSLIFGMPPLFPTATAMAFELCTYGLVSGLLYQKCKPQNLKSVYISLVSAMILGRIVWGIAMFICLSINGGAFTFQAFLAGALLNAVPGIVLQLLLIPAILVALDRAGVIRFHE